MENFQLYFEAGFGFAAGAFALFMFVWVCTGIGTVLLEAGFFSGLWKFVKGFFGFIWAVLRWLVT